MIFASAPQGCRTRTRQLQPIFGCCFPRECVLHSIWSSHSRKFAIDVFFRRTIMLHQDTSVNSRSSTITEPARLSLNWPDASTSVVLFPLASTSNMAKSRSGLLICSPVVNSVTFFCLPHSVSWLMKKLDAKRPEGKYWASFTKSGLSCNLITVTPAIKKPEYHLYASRWSNLLTSDSLRVNCVEDSTEDGLSTAMLVVLV